MAVNEQKVKDGWQFTLAQTKHAELRGHVEVAQQMFERQLDEQNAIIQVEGHAGQVPHILPIVLAMC